MSQTTKTTRSDSDDRKHTTRKSNRSGRGDHAFPMLSANKSAFPPEFRFMWASR